MEWLMAFSNQLCGK